MRIISAGVTSVLKVYNMTTLVTTCKNVPFSNSTVRWDWVCKYVGTVSILNVL